MASFAAALLVGLLSGNDAGVVIWRATLVMIACWVIGRIVGAVAQRVINEHIHNYKQKNPIPGDQTRDALTGVEATSDRGESAEPSVAASA